MISPEETLRFEIGGDVFKVRLFADRLEVYIENGVLAITPKAANAIACRSIPSYAAFVPSEKREG